MVLALGTFLVIFAACFSTPITVNYIAECFKGSVIEVAIIMNVYRQALGLALPFFIFPWQSRIGSGWYVNHSIGILTGLSVSVKLTAHPLKLLLIAGCSE